MKDHGGPAFPTTPDNFDSMDPAGAGMTMRDYFAAKAMAGMMAMDGAKVNGDPLAIPRDADIVATAAYKMADAMLAERAK